MLQLHILKTMHPDLPLTLMQIGLKKRHLHIFNIYIHINSKIQEVSHACSALGKQQEYRINDQ